MGIQNLMKLICDYAPAAVKDNAIKSYFGRKVAIDASMSLYQFLIAVRSEGQQLVASDGRPTGHLMGFFYRTIRMMDNGIKPVYVFDGKPPQMKSAELSKRQEKREEAQKGLTDAEERGDVEDIERFSKRLVKVTKEDTTECMRLLSLMGVPYIEAPCEAEAQCAAMARAGQVFATATEDMDSLTFGSNVLLRHLTFSEARKMPIREIHLDRVLAELNFTQKEFIDLCILLGCDYCDSVKGVGPAKAVALISQHKSIENILKNNLKLNIPEDWAYEAARELFENPEVSGVDNATLKWKQPDEEGLVQFMVEEKGFSEERIRNGVKKLQKCKLGSTQGRLDSFFSAVASPTPAAGKRKSTGSSAKGPVKKKAKLGGSSKFKR